MKIEVKKEIINSEDEEDEEDEEDYFSISNNYNKTSKNIINPLDPKSLHLGLSKVKISHKKEKKKLISENYKKPENKVNSKFSKMFNDLKLNYSILVYGIGEKSRVLKFFLDHYCIDGPSIIFKGYKPYLSIRDLLTRITFTIFGIDKQFGSPISHCYFIKQLFESNSKEKLEFLGGRYSYIPENLYILIFNIDGISLRNPTSQTTLALLSSIPQIHLISTCETFSPNLLWDTNLFEQFNWVVHTTPTYKPYSRELTFQKSLIYVMTQKGDNRDPDGILTVLQSLTSNTTEIFIELLKHLLEIKKKKIDFKDLFEICKENFLASTELNLRNQLREFFDHKIIIKKVIGDTECLTIPFGFETMQFIVDQVSSFEEKSE